MEPRVLQELGHGPVTLEQALQHLNLDLDGDSPPDHPDGQLVERLLRAAVRSVEKYTERRLIAVELELPLNCLPSVWCAGDRWAWTGQPRTDRSGVPLPGAPLHEVSSVTYVDTNGDTQTVDPASYQVDDFSEPGRLLWSRTATCPTVNRDVPNPVRVIYSAGYVDPNDTGDGPLCPEPLASAVLLMLGHLYENREVVVIGTITAELPLSVQYLLRPYKLHLGY